MRRLTEGHMATVTAPHLLCQAVFWGHSLKTRAQEALHGSGEAENQGSVTRAGMGTSQARDIKKGQEPRGADLWTRAKAAGAGQSWGSCSLGGAVPGDKNGHAPLSHSTIIQPFLGCFRTYSVVESLCPTGWASQADRSWPWGTEGDGLAQYSAQRCGFREEGFPGSGPASSSLGSSQNRSQTFCGCRI